MKERRYWAQPRILKAQVHKSMISAFLAESAPIASLKYEKQRKQYNLVTAKYISLLGGDGEYAIDLIKNWSASPYESILRWAVTVSIGRDIESELAKVQYRSDEAFGADIKPLVDAIPRRVMGTYGTLPEHEIDRSIARMRPDLRAEIDPWISRIVAIQNMRRRHTESHRLMDKAAKVAVTSSCMKTVEAIATLTQAVTEHDEISLMRGVYGDQAERLLKRASIAPVVPIALDHATSFTSDPIIAEQFASGAGAVLRINAIGVIARVHVPRRSMVASDAIFDELRGESECIVATHGSLTIPSVDIQVV